VLNGEMLNFCSLPQPCTALLFMNFRFCTIQSVSGKKCHAVINLLPFIELRVLQSSNSKKYFKLVVFMHFCWSCCYHGSENTFSPFFGTMHWNFIHRANGKQEEKKTIFTLES
jgi:hypothetical protein